MIRAHEIPRTILAHAAGGRFIRNAALDGDLHPEHPGNDGRQGFDHLGARTGLKHREDADSHKENEDRQKEETDESYGTDNVSHGSL